MEKTIKINLGGILFLIEEEAYGLLRSYLNSLDNRLAYFPGKKETIEDIELRIAEIFQSQKPPSGIIIKDNVEAAVSIIGKPDDLEIPETGAKRDHSDESPEISRIGNAIDEIFKAVVRVLFVLVRVILIVLGVSLVVGAFLALVTFVLVFIFKIPEAFATNINGNDLSYIPDFLNYIVSPQMTTWISVLTSIVVILPLLAIIYWAVRMIFWIRVKDAVFNLAALMIWVISIAALSVIILSEGVNYAETFRTTLSDELAGQYDTLYIKPGSRINDLDYDYKISVPDENYDIFLDEYNKELFIRSFIRIEPSVGQSSNIEVNKRSSGRSRSVARERTGALKYNFRNEGNTIILDEYFGYPAGMKWGFDNIRTRLSIPAGTVVGVDVDHECFMNHNLRHTDNDTRFWKITEEGLEPCL